MERCYTWWGMIMISWLPSKPGQAIWPFFSRKRFQVHPLLRALKNHPPKKGAEVRYLLQSIVDAADQTLRPTCCFIWLRKAEFTEGEGIPAQVRLNPLADLADECDELPIEVGVWSVLDLKKRHLRATLLEAGVKLVVPLSYQETVIGWLGLGRPRRGRGYNADEETFLEILAHQGATAIYAIWLRTKVADYMMLLRQAYRQTIQTQEAERRQLSETLHDETLQHLADISVRLGLLHNGNKVDLADLDDLRLRLANADRRLREIVRGLHPAVLSDLGLVEAVITFFEGISLNICKSPVKVELLVVGFDGQRLPDQELELTLYRFVQNATTNALTHANPDTIQVIFDWGVDSVEVLVKDNGCGMRTSLEEAVRTGHFGLLSMRERIEAQGGTFRLSSTPNRGTQVTGCIPLSVPAPALEQTERYILELI